MALKAAAKKVAPPTKKQAAAAPAAKPAPVKIDAKFANGAIKTPVKRGKVEKIVAPPPPVASKQATVTSKQMALEFAEQNGMEKKAAEELMTKVLELVVEHIKAGDKVRLGGLGVLSIRDRAARMGRNPATGEPIQIKASRKITFSPAKELREAL